jgi:hypothetical protein
MGHGIMWDITNQSNNHQIFEAQEILCKAQIRSRIHHGLTCTKVDKFKHGKSPMKIVEMEVSISFKRFYS